MSVDTFVVKRSTWRRGSRLNSMLLNGAGEMCCLGFLGRACGLSEGQILRRQAPSDTGVYPVPWPRILLNPGTLTENSVEGYILMSVNDAELGMYNDIYFDPVKGGGQSWRFIFHITSEQEREEWLTRGFAWIGINVTFED